MATRIDELAIEEVSGVSAPANELPGWLVMKSEELLKDVEQFEQSNALTYAALAANAQFLVDAEPEVQKAAALLLEHYDDSLSPADEPAKQSFIQKLRSFVKVPETVKAEPEVTKSEAEAEVTEPETVTEVEPEVTKAAPEPISEDIVKELPVIKELTEAVSIMTETTDALRTALEKSFDRIEALEVHAAGRLGIDDQEAVEKAAPVSGLKTAILAAASGRRVNIS